jgi:hypothetical protein
MEVTEFRPPKPVQNLYLGVPSADFFGTNMTDAAYGDAQGVITPFLIISSN